MKDWSTEDYLHISEDWMKYKRYKKRESFYWMTLEEFTSNFTEVITCLNNEKKHHLQKQLEYRTSPAIAVEVEAKHTTILNIMAIQPDAVSNPKDYEYATLRSFLVRVSNTESIEGTTVIKTAWHGPERDAIFETRLEPGSYKILYDVDCQQCDFGRNFVSQANLEYQHIL